MNTTKQNTNQAIGDFKMNLNKLLIMSLLAAGLTQNAHAGSTLVTDAVGTQELWTFEEILGVNKLVSKINQTDNKGITQTWDANGNMLTRTDAEGRVTTYTYNATNQKLSMTEASGTPQARITNYEYINANIDLVTKTISPSIFGNATKEVVNTYDDNQNITAVTINGFDAEGNRVTRATRFKFDSFGKVTEIDGPRTDVNDITAMAYYNCTTGSECGQLRRVTNALGHVTTYDSYDGAARLLQSTNANGVVTTYTYHPRGWMLSMTQTPTVGAVRVTTYDYDNVGQLKKITLPDGTEQNYDYDAAHDLREITDNLGNKIEYRYDAKGNRTHTQISDPDGTLVNSTIIAYDIRNFVESVNTGGSVTQMINDAVGNLNRETDPNENPTTGHDFDPLDRLTTTIDALTNDTNYKYNVADQVQEVEAPNGATTVYEYDDLGNRTKEISPDRGTTTYRHDDAGNVTRITDARGITVSYVYDALNRVRSRNFADASENVTYIYDSNNCGANIGRLCQVIDETGQSRYQYDAWGNTTQLVKEELNVTYTTRYKYDAANRVTELTYPNGRVVNYQRDAIGRITGVTTTLLGNVRTVISDRTYRADNLITGQTLGNGLEESRSYDLQGRVEEIALGGIETRTYDYDQNGNILAINKPVEGRTYAYDKLDRITRDRKALATDTVPGYPYSYDENGNRLTRGTRTYRYTENTNRLERDGYATGQRDEAGNSLNSFGTIYSLAYSESNRLRTVHRRGTLQGTYYYNAFGQRTQKHLASRTEVFHYDIQGNLIMRSSSSGSPSDDFIWADGELILYTQTQGRASDGTVVKESKTAYVTVDHLRTPMFGTSEDQVLTWRWDSDAFRFRLPDVDPDGDGSRLNILIGMPGQYYDYESQLYYNWNRYYDRRSGRYVTSDPIGLEGGLNTYGYVYGNPLIYSDENGLFVDQRAVNAALNGVKGGLGILGGALAAGAGALLFSEPVGEGSDIVRPWRKPSRFKVITRCAVNKQEGCECPDTIGGWAYGSSLRQAEKRAQSDANANLGAQGFEGCQARHCDPIACFKDGKQISCGGRGRPRVR